MWEIYGRYDFYKLWEMIVIICFITKHEKDINPKDHITEYTLKNYGENLILKNLNFNCR